MSIAVKRIDKDSMFRSKNFESSLLNHKILLWYRNIIVVRFNLNVYLSLFRYYNVHSICLADFFPILTNPYVPLSLSLIIFNFLSFFYIAGVYVAVHMITFRNKTRHDETEASKNKNFTEIFVQRILVKLSMSHCTTFLLLGRSLTQTRPFCSICFTNSFYSSFNR